VHTCAYACVCVCVHVCVYRCRCICMYCRKITILPSWLHYACVIRTRLWHTRKTRLKCPLSVTKKSTKTKNRCRTEFYLPVDTNHWQNRFIGFPFLLGNIETKWVSGESFFSGQILGKLSFNHRYCMLFLNSLSSASVLHCRWWWMPSLFSMKQHKKCSWNSLVNPSFDLTLGCAASSGTIL